MSSGADHNSLSGTLPQGVAGSGLSWHGAQRTGGCSDARRDSAAEHALQWHGRST